MSDIKFSCPHCNQHIAAPEDMLGEVVDCPGCRRSIRILAAQSEMTTIPQDTKIHLRGKQCPRCKKQTEFADRRCKHCGQMLDIASEPLGETRERSASLCTKCGKELGTKDRYCKGCGTNRRKCVRCGVNLSPDVILCVECGTNQRTGNPVSLMSPDGSRPAPVRKGGSGFIIAIAIIIFAILIAVIYHDGAKESIGKLTGKSHTQE